MGSDPVQREATRVVGPTLYERESAFGRGLASVDRAPTCLSRSIQTSASAGPGLPVSRLRRMLLLGAMVLSCAIVLGACGGGGDASTDTAAAPGDTAGQSSSDPNAPAPTEAPASADPNAGGATGVPTSGGDPNAMGDPTMGATGATDSGGSITVAQGTLLRTSDRTPGEFVDVLGKKPIIVVVHQPESVVDDSVLAEAEAASKMVKGTVLLTYTPSDFKKQGDLAEILGLYDAPSLAIVNRKGELQNFWAAYVDRNLLAYVLTKASKAAPSTVTNDDAPTGSTESGAAVSGLNEASSMAASS